MGGAKTMKPKKNRVAILDAGSQFGKVIDRRVRNLSIEAEILPIDTPVEKLAGYGAIIISGGPDSVYAAGAPMPDQRIWDSRIPILGICYGMQLINQHFGGAVNKLAGREDGQTVIKVDSDSPLFAGLGNGPENVLMSHGDSITQPEVAPGFDVIATSSCGVVAGITNEQKRIWGVQFHPEVDLTDNGIQMIQNFLVNIAGLAQNYTMENRLELAKQYIREIVGSRNVLAFLSGGVDSTVLARLLAEALPPEQIVAVHIDNGFMRYRESDGVKKALAGGGINVEIIDAQDDFYNATTIIDDTETLPLNRVTDPETKRRIIGDTFMQVRESVERGLGLDPDQTVLAQGTLRPDLIESASSKASAKADAIKTHHNDTELVRDLREKGLVVEPLQDLHKDEVRELGRMLGLPEELVMRQPFPGPGLAIRLLCADQPYITDEFDAINEKLEQYSDDNIAACLLPVRTVGVQGDGRSYSYLACLSGEPNWPELFRKARDITNSITAVNRVVFALDGEKIGGPVKTITKTHLTPDAIEQLRLADKCVNDILRKYSLLEKLSQVPVVSFPVNFRKVGARSIGIRTFITNDFMTGKPAVPGQDIPETALAEICEKISAIPGIAKVVYDLTAKPPGTTEWE
jgi:GMP synthase (glutamine-hydrolysing)